MSRNLTPLSKIRHLSDSVIAVLGCNPGPLTLLGTNAYLVGTGRERILIDTGDNNVPEFQASLETVLQQTKSTISQILITHHHQDHLGGLADVRRLCNKNIPAYKFDFVSTELREKFKSTQEKPEIDIQFIQDKSKFSVEGATLTAHYNPGHCDDHMIIWMDEEEAVFSADSVLGEGTTKFTHLSQYMRSLHDIKGMNPRVIYPGHGPVVKDPSSHVDYYIKHRLDRENQIVELLTHNTCSANSIVKVLYKDYPEYLHGAAAEVILLHLHKLEHDGKASCSGDDKSVNSDWSIELT